MAQESWKLEQEDPAVSPSPPDARGPCSNNCGFFGSSSTMNLCSSCYLNLLTSKASVAAGAGAVAVAVAGAASSGAAADISLSPTPSRPASPSSATVFLPVAPASTSLPSQQQPPQKQTPSRCLACRKRVGLMGFKCRCGDVFCALHRYSDKHNCSFDYKAAARAAISKANPVVKADKIEKI